MSNRSFFQLVYLLLKFCGSITFGIVIMILLAIAMGWATFLEREMGTPVAQYLVYASPWFYRLIGLLTLNIILSAVLRLPRLFTKSDGKRRLNRALLPFYIAHIGIVLLVFGCLITATRSSKARATIAEGSAVETAVDVDSRLIRAEIYDYTVPKRQPDEEGDPNFTTVEIPFKGGPLNWRDQTSADLWRVDVAEPILALKPEKKFFNKLGKKASELSQQCAYLASRFGDRSRAGVLYDRDGFKIEALEYATFADYAPVPELRANLVLRKPDGTNASENFILPFPFEGAVIGGDPLATTNKSHRATLDNGLRVVYSIAQSSGEANAFLNSTPTNNTADCAVLHLDGERYEVELDALATLSQYGDLDAQSDSLQTQRDEIERRLAVEREYIETAEIPAEEETPVVEEAAERTEEAPVAEEAAETTEEAPVVEEAAETTEAAPVVEEAAERTEEAPVTEEAAEITEEAPVVEEAAERTEAAPVAEEVAERTEEDPVAEEVAERTEEAPVAEEDAERTEEAHAAEEDAETTEETHGASTANASVLSPRYAQELSELESKALKLKPKQTTTREDLEASVRELRELSAKLADFADAATDPTNTDSNALNEYQKILREYHRRRTLNYLMTTWSQFESAANSSQEFCDNLEQMLAETTRRCNEVALLREKTTLGDNGWRILSFDCVPTQFQELTELAGWTAAFTLLSPQNEPVELTLYSELAERNRYPESGRAYGALWLEERKGDDREYGRRWSPNLDKPRLELLQTPDGRLLYRYLTKNICAAGSLELSPTGEPSDTYKTSTLELPAADGVDFEQLVSFQASELTLQDVLGARILPTLFTKDQANEFYGKLKVRVTLDEVSETFWLQTIPLESVEKKQADYMTKTIASKSRRARICLSDKEIALGVALFVKRFAPTYEPGSSTPASFASLTRLLPAGMTSEEQAAAVVVDTEKDVLIQMNRPGVLKSPDSSKVFWAYQDSFRGPFKPGDPQYDSVVKGNLLPGEETPRDSVYYTIIALNDDPGRGLKYFACLLVMWGTALLVYRKSGAKKDRVAQEESKKISAVESSRTGVAATSFLALMCVATLLAVVVGNLASLRADVIEPDNERFEMAQAARSKIDWTEWRLLPVFDGGRRMPLNTFAQIMVRDITGANRPTIAPPLEIIQRLEGDQPLNMPSLDEFLADLGSNPAQDKTDATEWYKDTTRRTLERQRNAAARLRNLFGERPQRYGAAELLFAWLAEPEVWEHVPFILDEKNVVAREVLRRTEDEIAAQRGFLSPADFETPAVGSEKTLVEVYRTMPSADPEVVKALNKVEDRLANWRSVVFVPAQGASTRPRMRINKILYGSMPSSMGMGMAHGMIQSSPMSRLDASASALERLLAREKRQLRKTSPLNDKDHLLRQRTKLSNSTTGRDTLTFARQIAVLGETSRLYSLESSGELFAKTLKLAAETLAELREHRDTIIREETFSIEYRQEVARAVSALDEIVCELERATLALTTESPQTLDVLPVLRERVLRVSETQDAPWVSLQTLLWSADHVYQRFIDPTQSLETSDQDVEKLKPTRPDMDDFFAPLATTLQKSRQAQRTSRPAADAFLDAVLAYRRGFGDEVTSALERFAVETRRLAEESEPQRAALAGRAATSPDVESYLAKTRYPQSGALNAELFYYDLNAFYWNWIACLCAVVAFLLSYLRQGLRALTRRVKGSDAPGGERVFFSIGVLCLVGGCAVAFLGGAVRAYITGWAPVANMFETVVLLAFLIATIAIFYTLAPIWAKPYLNAWRLAAFNFKALPASEKRVALAMAPLRAVLVLAFGYLGIRLWLHSHDVEGHAFDAIRRQIVDAVTMQGFLDSFTVLATFLLVVWFVPRFIVTLLAILTFPKTVCRRDDLDSASSGRVWNELVEEVVARRAFLTASAIIAALVAAAAYFNSSEFNPNIRPLVAILRSNFWLTIHVIAIIVSYALGAIAWVVSLTSLAYYIFGRYQDRDPEYSKRVVPVIATMLRSAVLFLTAGIILGARWADYSWGRFWSWDPKEVWAFVTLLVYLVVLHAHRLSGRNRFVLAIGATFGALAIIMTWYGLSFVMGGGGRHAYTSGESNKVAVLYLLFAANILWALLATARYYFEKVRAAGRDVQQKALASKGR